MMKTINLKILTCVGILFVLTGCEKFLDVGMPDTRISNSVVFTNDQTAVAAANSMYRSLLLSHGMIGGTVTNLTLLTAMSADEVVDYRNVDVYTTFYTNTLSADNEYVKVTWNAAYNTIYEANAVLEGVTGSASLSEGVRDVLEGEALFVRALCHFYLVNLFGDVPLIVSTDYRVNATAERALTDDVYGQVIDDLLAARELLPTAGTAGNRLRPSADAATALLARVYLYREDHAAAEAEATRVLSNTAYALEENAADVFLAESDEAVWQLSQVVPSSFPTGDAWVFIIWNDFFQNAMSDELLNDFEAGDARRDAWIGTWTTEEGDTYYHSYKYKEQLAADNTSFTETLSVLRLAEQYLIRAEARARQGKLAEAIADLDRVRVRATLPLIADVNPGIGQEALIEQIMQERRIELFCELGHRWFDLKRTGKADVVLTPIKPEWTSNALLYPLPEAELMSNPNLRPQNGGY